VLTGVLALVFLVLHLPYLPSSLEDLDSINFALGIRRFDVAQHRPHPPGYPLFILIAKGVDRATASEIVALALVSVLAGALGVLAIANLFRRAEAPNESTVWPIVATAVAVTSPLYWFSAVRPLSDMTGLAAALGVQALTLGASSTWGLSLASVAAGFATGFRSQVAWLTVPLLLMRGLRAGGWGLTPRFRQAWIPALIACAFLAGVLVWFVPLVAVSGGPAAYWHALFDQGAEDLGNIQMLWTHHDLKTLADAVYYSFVAPWAVWPLAAIVLLLALIGLFSVTRRAPRAAAWLAAGFGPYLAFDLLFQETFTGRYALPLVVPMAYLAVEGTRRFPRRSGVAVAIAIAMFSAHVGGTSIAAYSRQQAPAFRLLGDMRTVARSLRDPPVLAMDRRESLDFRRPIAWTDAAMPRMSRTLPAPAQHEWLEAVKYWNSGADAPVWFVVDPKRTSMALVQHGDPAEYRWQLPYPALLSGVRPNEMDWYRVNEPDWYLGEGWSLTPETAGVAEHDGRGLQHASITGWIKAGPPGGTVLIGGRNLEPTSRPQITVTIAGAKVADWTVMPGYFLRLIGLPIIDSDLPIRYLPIEVTSTPSSHVAIEQFDASMSRPLTGLGDGWYEPELNPDTGRRWRWMSEQAELKVTTDPRPVRSHAAPLAPLGPISLHLEGESPRKYFSRPSHVMVRVGTRRIFDASIADDFSLDLPIPDPKWLDSIVLETDQTFSPADRSSRSQDRRHLGLRIFKCELRTSPRPPNP
jgi:hypothetical protein